VGELASKTGVGNLPTPALKADHDIKDA